MLPNDLLRELKRTVDELQALNEIGRALTSTLDLPEVLRLVMGRAQGLIKASRFSLLLMDEGTQELRFEVATGPGSERLAALRLPAGEGIAGWVAREGAAGPGAGREARSALRRAVRRHLRPLHQEHHRRPARLQGADARGDRGGERRGGARADARGSADGPDAGRSRRHRDRERAGLRADPRAHRRRRPHRPLQRPPPAPRPGGGGHPQRALRPPVLARLHRPRPASRRSTTGTATRPGARAARGGGGAASAGCARPTSRPATAATSTSSCCRRRTGRRRWGWRSGCARPIAAHTFLVDRGLSVRLTASFGVATWPLDGRKRRGAARARRRRDVPRSRARHVTRWRTRAGSSLAGAAGSGAARAPPTGRRRRPGRPGSG